MFCPNCGNKTENNSFFCGKCGCRVNNGSQYNNNQNKRCLNSDTSLIRIGIKEDAKSKPKNNLVLCLIFSIAIPIVLYFSLVISLSMFFESSNLDTFCNALLICCYLIFIFFSIGIIKNSIVISRGENPSISEILFGLFHYPKKVFEVFFELLLVSVIVAFLSRVPFVGSISLLVLEAYFVPYIWIHIYSVLDDKNNLSFRENSKKSMSLIDGHRLQFWAMSFSFIGWSLLGLCTCGILYFWLYPYRMISNANLYRNIIGEVNYNGSKSGLSDDAIIGWTVGIYFGFFIVLSITIMAIFIIFFSAGTNSINNKIKWQEGFQTASICDTNYVINIKQIIYI